MASGIDLIAKLGFIISISTLNKIVCSIHISVKKELDIMLKIAVC